MSFVNPSTRKIYAGQTLGEVTERVTVSLAPGLNFENKWNKMPTAGGESIEVQHSDLLKNYDPEMNGSLDYPLTKQFVFGVNLTF